MMLNSHAKILIVDDKYDARMTVKAMLEEMGFNNITEARNGREAHNIMDDSPLPFQLIITDHRMPEVSGLSFLRQLRMGYPQLPVLMISAYADEETVQAASQAGISAFLRKPFNAEQLKEKVDYIKKQLRNYHTPSFSNAKKQAEADSDPLSSN